MAHKAKEAADAVIAKAEATKAVAQDISNKLEALFLYTSTPLYTFTPSTTLYPTTFGRFRRQDASITATNYRIPVNCDDLKSTMTDLKNAMDYGAPDYDPAKATTIVSILTSLDLSELTLWCSSSDLSELFDAKNAAKDNADAVVTTQTMLISAKTDELNALVLLILALNQQISAAGGTIIDPGTSVTPVPVDGEWQEWGQWSHCDPSCSCGKKIRAWVGFFHDSLSSQNSKISAEEKKERSGWGRVELGQLGTS